MENRTLVCGLVLGLVGCAGEPSDRAPKGSIQSPSQQDFAALIEDGFGTFRTSDSEADFLGTEMEVRLSDEGGYGIVIENLYSRCVYSDSELGELFTIAASRVRLEEEQELLRVILEEPEVLNRQDAPELGKELAFEILWVEEGHDLFGFRLQNIDQWPEELRMESEPAIVERFELMCSDRE